MSRYLLYVSDKEGMVQARLALHLLRQANSAHQWTLQHGGIADEAQISTFDDVLVLGEGELSPALTAYPQHDIRHVVASPLKTIATLKHKPDEYIFPPADNTQPPTVEKPAEMLTQKVKIVGVTSCPTGIAHTFMAAEGLQVGAESLGFQIKVETQGSVGADNELTSAEIAEADIVIIAADTKVDLQRFVGKRLYQTNTKSVIQNGKEIIQRALAQAKTYGESKSQETKTEQVERSHFYSHLMTGVSYMLPFVVAGGLLIALGFFFGSLQFGDQGIYIYEEQYRGTLAATLFWIGKDAFALFVPILGGYIAYSQAGRPGLAPGMIGGYIAMNTGAGFLGAILAGFLAGWSVHRLNQAIKLPKSLEGLKPTLLLPLLGTTFVGLMMYYIIGEPVSQLLAWLTSSLQGLNESSAALLGALLGLMMAFDMGGPVNKAAYTFATALIASQVYAPMAAVMAAGMTPPLAIFFATLIFKNRFTIEEREAGKASGVLGLSFITEGAIPFAAKDPLRVIPALMAGSATTGAISMAAGCLLRAPHGGIFVLFIPNAVSNLGWYLIALLSGTAVSCILLGLLKPVIKLQTQPTNS